MALGLVLWISWICVLLFDCSAGLPSVKGYGYPYKGDSRNIGDDWEDETLSGTFNSGTQQASNNQPTGPLATRYKKPSAARWPALVSSQQNHPNMASAPAVERLVNGDLRDWGLDDPEEMLLFPLHPNYQQSDPTKPQPGPFQPQSTSLGGASTNRMPASPAGGSTPYASQTAHYKAVPSSTSQTAKSPIFDSWQRKPVDSNYDASSTQTGIGSPNQDLNSGSSGFSNIPHLVYEQVFQYPSENTESSSTAGGYSQANYLSKESSTASTQNGPAFPSYPTNVGAQPGYPSGMGSSPSRFTGGGNHNFGKMDYRPRDENSLLQQKPVADTQKGVVTQRVSEPIHPHYITQSRSGYLRAGHRNSNSKYSPIFSPPMPVRSKGVKGQPAAPKDVKNP